MLKVLDLSKTDIKTLPLSATDRQTGHRPLLALRGGFGPESGHPMETFASIPRLIFQCGPDVNIAYFYKLKT